MLDMHRLPLIFSVYTSTTRFYNTIYNIELIFKHIKPKNKPDTKTDSRTHTYTPARDISQQSSRFGCHGNASAQPVAETIDRRESCGREARLHSLRQLPSPHFFLLPLPHVTSCFSPSTPLRS